VNFGFFRVELTNLRRADRVKRRNAIVYLPFTMWRKGRLRDAARRSRRNPWTTKRSTGNVEIRRLKAARFVTFGNHVPGRIRTLLAYSPIVRGSWPVFITFPLKLSLFFATKTNRYLVRSDNNGKGEYSRTANTVGDFVARYGRQIHIYRRTNPSRR